MPAKRHRPFANLCNMANFAPLPEPPYYAVIFANQLSNQPAGYETMADRMGELAENQPGFLGIDSTRNGDGFGITVSYWADESALLNWKKNAEHTLAQEYGKDRWYTYYSLRVAQVQRQYEGPEGR